MRRDAQEHRERLIDAARIVFTREGIDAPLEAVLQQAGLGRGTLYRHFKNRSQLGVALLQADLDELERFVEQHLDDRTLLREFLCRQVAVAAGNPSNVDTLMLEDAPEEVTALRARANALYSKVRERAHNAGSIPGYFDLETFRLVTRMLAASLPWDVRQTDAVVPEVALDLIFLGLLPR